MRTSSTVAIDKSTIVQAWQRASNEQAPLMAAGVAFYTFLSIFPALIAAVLVYGLVADPATVSRQSERISGILPPEAAALMTDQMSALISTESTSLGFGLVLSVLLALYSASGGVSNLMTAIHAVFGYEETRSFVRRKVLALVVTVGGIVFMLVLITLVAIVPALLQNLVDVPGLRLALQAARWIALGGALVLAVATLFKVAPDRPSDAPSPFLNAGVLIAAGLWLAVSVGFSLYVSFFGSYGETYGALAGVVVLLLWLWIGYFALLLGATVEALRERAPARDHGSPALV